jgi:hypothetical protein
MRLGPLDRNNLQGYEQVDVPDGTYCPACHCDLGGGDCVMCMQFPQDLDTEEMGDGILTQDSYNWCEQ